MVSLEGNSGFRVKQKNETIPGQETILRGKSEAKGGQCLHKEIPEISQFIAEEEQY